MATVADSNGKLTTTFTIPPNVLAGSKSVKVYGKGGSFGEAVFVGQGTLTTTTLRQVRNVTTWYYDPLAQTFTPESDFALAGVDLWFTKKNTEVRVQIRETVNGYPSRVILAEKVMKPVDIVVTGGNYTRVLFDAPLPVRANIEYAIVILCDDADTRVAIAEAGKFDATRQRWVSVQPYSVGVLMSSSNASAWTTHQDKDLAFRILRAQYTQVGKTVDLGGINITSATDLILYALADVPSADTSAKYELTLPDGSMLAVADGQPIQFTKPTTGRVQVRATLAGSSTTAPTLFPDTEIVAGTVKQEASYYSRSITAISATKAVLIYDAIIPSGSSVTPELQVDSGEWKPFTATGATPQDNGVVEYTFRNSISGASLIKMRLRLYGSPTARPIVRNIRFMAVM